MITIACLKRRSTTRRTGIHPQGVNLIQAAAEIKFLGNCLNFDVFCVVSSVMTTKRGTIVWCISLFMAAFFMPLGCNSYGLDSKIAAALKGSGGGDSGTFFVSSTSPANGSSNVAAQTAITINFSQAVLISSLNVPLNSPQCSGNVQVSITNFITCLRVLSSITNSDARSVTVTTFGLPLGQTVKIKVLNSVTSLSGTALGGYASSGFQTTSPPCGPGNCFLTMQANGFAIASGSVVFPVFSGVTAGKFIIAPGGASSFVYDPFSATMSAGPPITATGNGAHAIPIKSGGNAGKTLVFMGGSLSTNQLYDPMTNTFNAHVAACNTLTTGALSLEVLAGMHQGKYFVETANALNTCLFDPVADTFVNGASAINAPAVGAFSIFVESGLHVGKSLIVAANAMQNTLFSHGVDHTVTSPTSLPLNLTAAGQPSAFYIRSGPQLGQILIVNSNGSMLTQWYDLASGTFSSVSPIAAPNLSCAVGSGSANFPINFGVNAGKTFVICGAAGLNTSIYNPLTATFSAGPVLPFAVNTNHLSIQVENGMYPGTILIVGAGNYTVYFP